MLVPKDVQPKLITAIIEPDSPAYSFDTFHDQARELAFTILLQASYLKQTPSESPT